MFEVITCKDAKPVYTPLDSLVKIHLKVYGELRDVYVPKGASFNHYATDKNGRVYLYSEEPILGTAQWVGEGMSSVLAVTYIGNFKHSLEEVKL